MQGRQLTVSLLPNQIIDGGTFDHLRENDNNPHVELGLFHSLAELHPTPLHDACGHVLPGANKDVSVSPPLSWCHPCQACPKLVYRLGAGSNVKCRTSIPIRPKPISNRSETRGSAPLGSTFCFEDFRRLLSRCLSSPVSVSVFVSLPYPLATRTAAASLGRLRPVQ